MPNFFADELDNLEISVEVIAFEEDEALSEDKDKKSPPKEVVDEERKFFIRPEKKVKNPKPKSEPKIKKDPKSAKAKITPNAKPKVVDSGAEGDSDFEEVLAEMERLRAKEEIRDKTQKNFKRFPGLTQGEKNMVRGQVYSCWRTVANNIFAEEDLQGVKIRVRVSLDKQGNVKQAKPLGATRKYIPLENELYRQLVDSTINAFYRCNKIKNLPPEKYEYWQEFEFIFDPSSNGAK
jgi:hypothetical protein